jgi:hypothetical protein
MMKHPDLQTVACHKVPAQSKHRIFRQESSKEMAVNYEILLEAAQNQLSVVKIPFNCGWSGVDKLGFPHSWPISVYNTNHSLAKQRTPFSKAGFVSR